MKKGGYAHELTLRIFKDASESEGKRVIDLAGKSPDLIEAFVKDGKVVINAIDAVNANTKGKKPRSKYDNISHLKWKKKLYEALGFDEVKIIPYKTI